jgi:N-methylhydantoinase A
MVAAIKEITINEGVDPRDSLLMAGGGAAGLNIVPIAHELGCNQVLVPRMAGALSACGAQYTDVVTEFSTNQVTKSDQFDFAGVNTALAGLEASMEEFKAGLQARGISSFRFQFFVEARYQYQVWELEVPLAGPRFQSAAEVAAVVSSFHAAHESIFAVSEVDRHVEFIQWKGRVTGELSRPPLKPVEKTTAVAPVPSRKAQAYFTATGSIEIPLYRGETLGPGTEIAGPALIVEPITTLVLYPGSRATVTKFNNYMVDVPS